MIQHRTDPYAILNDVGIRRWREFTASQKVSQNLKFHHQASKISIPSNHINSRLIKLELNWGHIPDERPSKHFCVDVLQERSNGEQYSTDRQ
jgi:hypothetical protein